MPKFRVLKSPNTVRPFTDRISKAADSERLALGFLPHSAYVDTISQGKLWVAAPPDKSELAGYILFGGIYPNLRIFQIFTAPEFRGQSVARCLVDCLSRFGEDQEYTQITVRIAHDLEAADTFWGNLGFRLVRQLTGGSSRKRIINLRVKQLDTPTLFDLLADKKLPLLGFKDIKFRPQITNRSNIYILDLNVILDVVRDRDRRPVASAVIRAGLNHKIMLQVTKEFVAELERSAKKLGPDDLLELARELPMTEQIDDAILQPLIERLRPVVFPGRIIPSRDTARHRSDLRHLAHCVHHQVFAFVTSDELILEASERLRRLFGLEVVPPSHFIESLDETEIRGSDIRVQLGNGEVVVRKFDENERAKIEDLMGRMGFDQTEAATIWRSGVKGSPRQRVCAWADDNLVGVASWDMPTVVDGDSQIFLLVDELHYAADVVIGHFLEVASRNFTTSQPRSLSLHIAGSQGRTIAVAKSRGYSVMSQTTAAQYLILKKLHVGTTVDDDNWNSARVMILKHTNLSLPPNMPTFENAEESGIEISGPSGPKAISIFDLETLLSPVLFLFSGRIGVIVPIRAEFAEQLLGPPLGQQMLFPSKEALMRVEKAYFRSTRNSHLFSMGCPIVFYVSGKGRGPSTAVGIARVVSSQIVQAEEAFGKYQRFGVLESNKFNEISDRDNNVHVITFDNYKSFSNPLSIAKLRHIGVAGGENLVTAKRIDSEQLVAVCDAGLKP